MVFSSVIFVFAFLPLTLLFYYISKVEYRNFILLAASLIFYAYGEPRYVILMVLSIVCNYFLARVIQNRPNEKKFWLILGITYNLGILFVFKYLGFSISIFNNLFHQNMNMISFVLPIGISFYTFQCLSYIIDVYRGTAEAQKSIVSLGLYISLFPQLVAGPIVRYNAIERQIRERKVGLELFGEGAKRFICGFCKKILLSNNLAVVSQLYFERPAVENSVAGAWLGAICFSLQIYYDFSGYSDMAIGLGKMFGFEFEENFNYPYISRSITEFWRRWHISLGQWFRDYVYIPLGGGRVSTGRHIFNLGVVWLLTGIWHGADFTFITWGILYFIALVVEKYIVHPERLESILSKSIYRILLLFYVNFCWVIFNAKSLKEGISYWLSMFGMHSDVLLYDMEIVRVLQEYGIFVAAAIIFSMPVKRIFAGNRIYAFVDRNILPFIYLLGFLWSVSFLIIGAHNPFIYFNF